MLGRTYVEELGKGQGLSLVKRGWESSLGMPVPTASPVPTRTGGHGC